MHRVYCALVFKGRSSPQSKRALSNCCNLQDRDSESHSSNLLTSAPFFLKIMVQQPPPERQLIWVSRLKKEATASRLFAPSVYSQRKRKSFPNDLYVYHHHHHMAFPHSIQRNVTVPVIPPSSIFFGKCVKASLFPVASSNSLFDYRPQWDSPTFSKKAYPEKCSKFSNLY